MVFCLQYISISNESRYLAQLHDFSIWSSICFNFCCLQSRWLLLKSSFTALSSLSFLDQIGSVLQYSFIAIFALVSVFVCFIFSCALFHNLPASLVKLSCATSMKPIILYKFIISPNLSIGKLNKEKSGSQTFPDFGHPHYIPHCIFEICKLCSYLIQVRLSFCTIIFSAIKNQGNV